MSKPRHTPKGSSSATSTPLFWFGGAIAILVLAAAIVSISTSNSIETASSSMGSGGTSATNDAGGFEGWIEKSKVQAISPVSLVRHDAKVGGYALQAQEDISGNNTLLAIPEELIMDAQKVLEHGALGVFLRESEESMVSGIQQHLKTSSATAAVDQKLALVRIAAWLISEAKMGSSSAWHAWLDGVLPSPSTGNGLTTEYHWDPQTARRCLGPHQQKRWEKSVGELGLIVGALRAGCKKTPSSSCSELFGMSFDKHADLELVQWALSIVHTRSWLRPAPKLYTVIPLADMTDLRASVTVKPHYDSEGDEHLHETTASVAARANKRLRQATDGGFNAVLIFDDGEERDAEKSAGTNQKVAPVVLASIKPLKKGAYVWAHPPGGETSLEPIQTVRRYGFVDPEANAVPSYVSEATLPKKPVPATSCSDEKEHLLTFSARSGAPSPALDKCLTEHFDGNPTEIKAFLAAHASTVLKQIHSINLLEQCNAWAAKAASDGKRKRQASQVGVGAGLLASYETLMRQAFVQLRGYASQMKN